MRSARTKVTTTRAKAPWLGFALAAMGMVGCLKHGSDDGPGNHALAQDGGLAVYDASGLVDPESGTAVAVDDAGVAPDASVDASSPPPAPMFAIGGSVTGLAGVSDAGAASTGVQLTNALPDGGTDVTTALQNGSFVFPTLVPSGASYAIAIGAQPASPPQQCTVSGGSGTVVGSAVTSAVVNCAANSFVIGGTVSGLSGSGLVLANGTNRVSVSANGTFAFSAPVPKGTSYDVTVAAQPQNPAQTCTVSAGTGVVASANVASVRVACATSAFTVGGTVSGLSGSGLSLRTATGDALVLTANGSFAFATPLPSGSSYTVIVAAQPTNPWQTCTVSNATGTVGNGAVSSVGVACTTNTYTLGGAVSGLAGSGLTLGINGAALAVTSNGAFQFASPLASGASYAVTVQTQPKGPAQTCSVSGGSGKIAGGDVTGVAVACSTSAFAVGGTIVGLKGTGLVLEDDGGNAITVASGATTFTFSAPVASGAAYDVTIATQPSGPAQSCSVSAGSGVIGSGAVTGVLVDCATSSFSIGGTVSGLAGQGLVLANGPTALAVSANGTFAFGTPVASGTAYAVTVKTQPTSPSQTCSVASATGTVGSSNVTGIAVTCATGSFTVGGAVSNLAGRGLVLLDEGASPLTIDASGVFTFGAAVASGAPYAVTVGTQPTTPWQTCTVTGGGGTVGNAAVTSVQVGCVTNLYTVSATVTGLTGSGLTLALNGTSLAVSSNGTFQLSPSVASGASYGVTVKTQPTGPTQTCSVSGASGTMAGSNVSVAVSCGTNTYAIGGTVAGLTGSGLTLTDSGGDTLAIPAGATGFTFPTKLASGAAYDVQIADEPSSPAQSCTVSGASGTVGGAAVTSVSVNCGTNSYSVGGTVSGLAGSGLVLQNGSATVAISANGSFALPPVASGSTYDVTVHASPSSPSQTCAVASGTGTVTNAAIGNVQVTCTTESFAITVSVSGDTGEGLVLVDDGSDTLSIGGDGTYTFAVPVASGGGYSVQVSSDPIYPWEGCSVSNAAGTVGAGPVSGIQVVCYPSYFYVSGSVSGFAGGSGLVLAMNGQSISVTGSSFEFPGALASETSYAISVQSNPTGPTQSCSVTTDPSGTIYGSDVGDVVVTCDTPTYAISGTVTGLVGNDLLLTDNGGDEISLDDGQTSFTFPTPIASGATYDVGIALQPANPDQICTVSGGSGTVGSGPVGTVSVNCEASTFTVSGTITGLSGGGLELNDGAGDTFSVSGTSFSTPPIENGTNFLVNVVAQPTSPWQTCTVSNASGTISGANVGGVIVSCTTNAYAITLTASGIEAGTDLTVTDGSSSLSVSSNGTFTFPTAVASGATYAENITGNSPYQTCVVGRAPSGTITNAGVNVTLECGSAAYPLTLDVAQSGSSPCNLIIYAYDNGGNEMSFTLPAAFGGDYTFSTAIPYGASYDVTLDTGCMCNFTGGSSATGTATGPLPLVFMACSAPTIN